MKKIIATLAAIATAAALTGCRYIKPGIYETIGTANTETSFNISGEIYGIYNDRLQQSETYIIILSDNGTPFYIYDDEILNYYDLEVYELMQLEKE